MVFDHVASTDHRDRLERIARALINAVRNSIIIRIRFRYATPTRLGHRLQGVVRAVIDTVRNAIAIGVRLRNTTPALSRSGFFIIKGTGIDAVCDAVLVVVEVPEPAATLAGMGLAEPAFALPIHPLWVPRAHVLAVDHTVAVIVASVLRDPATTQTRPDLVGVVRALVHILSYRLHITLFNVL